VKGGKEVVPPSARATSDCSLTVVYPGPQSLFLNLYFLSHQDVQAAGVGLVVLQDSKSLTSNEKSLVMALSMGVARGNQIR
jgi:hypothetical protein